jgi:hypothetical protein
MTLDPTRDFEKIITDFEEMQARYQSALASKAAAEDNERREREAYFHRQRADYEESQRRDRRCALVQRFIDLLGSLIQELEWGQVSELNRKTRNLEADMSFQIRSGVLKNGQ